MDFLFSDDPSYVWYRILLLVLLVLLLVVLLRWHSLFPSLDCLEGFEQKQPFVISRERDAFYAEVYDTINSTSGRVAEDLSLCTKPSSVNGYEKIEKVLEVQCGTGSVLKALQLSDASLYGMDTSSAMVAICREKGLHNIIEGDALETISYSCGKFGYVFCLRYAIYEFKDKLAFLRNCARWLKSGGWLSMHVIDLDTLVARQVGGRSKETRERLSVLGSLQVSGTVELSSFEYRWMLEFPLNKEGPLEALESERFVDRGTGATRLYERVLFVESSETIIGYAEKVGFSLHAQNSLSDPGHYIYVFMRRAI